MSDQILTLDFFAEGGSVDLEKLHALVEGLPAPFFFKDEMMNYRLCNSEFLEYVGKERHQVINKSVYDISPFELAKVYDTKDRELFENGGKQVYETQVLHADGSQREVMFHKSVIQIASGKKIGIVGVMLDITERKNAETSALLANQALSLVTADLEKRVEERTEELRRALDKEHELSQLRQGFLDTIAHQFRTPLTIIRSNAEILTHAKVDMPERRKRSLDRIIKSINAITHLLESVQELGSAGTSQQGFGSHQIVTVEGLFETVLSKLSKLVSVRRDYFVIEGGQTPFITSRSAVEDILFQILLNSLKYANTSDTSPNVNIIVKCFVGSGKTFCIDVIDNGIGIEPSEEKHIFQMFYRSRRVENTIGLGLGLPLALERAVSLGGTIQYIPHTEPEEIGAHFRIFLPYRTG